jgi:hypothetical protein
MKKKGCLKYLEKKQYVSGKRIVGIDPAKDNHQATVVDEHGISIGQFFLIPVSINTFVPCPGLTPFFFFQTNASTSYRKQ